MKGIIKRIPDGKEFGFIRAIGYEKEYFFHKSDFSGFFEDLVNDLRNGEEIEVTFNPNETPKGLRASDVRRTEHPNEAV